MRTRGALGVLAAAACLLAAAPAAAAPGDLDPSFGKHGMTRLSAGGAGSMAAAPGGGLALITQVGGEPVVVKLDGRGRVDSRFADGGRYSPAAASARAVAVDEEGRVLVAARAPSGLRVIRLDPHGSPDHSFGSGGVAVPPAGAGLEPWWIAARGDGRVTVGATGADAAVVLTLSPSGQPEFDFGADGAKEIPGQWPQFAAAPDGGTFVAVTSGNNSRVAKINSDGDDDAQWGTGGTRQFDLDAVTSLAAAPGGELAVSGYRDIGWFVPHGGGASPLLAILGPDGRDVQQVNPGLGAVADDGRSFWVRGLAYDSAGRLVMAGSADYTTNELDEYSDVAVQRLLPGGRLDRSFGDGGRVRVPHEMAAAPSATGAVAQQDGRVVATFPGGTLRLLDSGKRHDRDADGVVDRRDACPLVFGLLRGGCRWIPTHLTMSHSRSFDFEGRLSSKDPRCVRRRGPRGGLRVDVVRLRAGHDRTFGRARTLPDGVWYLQKHAPPGRYRARFPATQQGATGVCKPSRSRAVSVR